MTLFSGNPCQRLNQLLKRAHLNFTNALPNLQKSTNVDAIDCFTTELLEEKALKWHMFKKTTLANCAAQKNTLKDSFVIATKSVLADYENLKKSDLWLDIRELSDEQMCSLIKTSLDISNNDDFIYLIKQCVKWNVLPSKCVLGNCLEHLSLLGRADLIEELDALYKEKYEITLTEYESFGSYKALALWKNGSLDLALTTLVNCYGQEKTAGYKNLHSTFKLISQETLRSKSEAVLIQLVSAAETIYKRSQDIFTVGCVWKSCFESDWFSDQQIAENLFADFQELRNIVFKRATPLCCDFLRENNTDAVHRLIELFLKYENKNASKACLNALFMYNYWRRNLRACAEIVRNSIDLDIPLSAAKSEKLITLLLNQPLSLRSKPSVEKFKYKF